MKVHIGCSGWNYKEWRGEFYPEKLAKKNWLEYYSGKFDTVEVNNTFYRFPKDEHLEGWRDTVPKDFLFTLKGSRYVSHMKKLKEVKESVQKFIDAAHLLKNKLGCILWQLPPNLHRNDEKLDQFCKDLNSKDKNVIEFRHESWYDKKVYEILSEHEVSFCAISSPDFPEEMITTNQTGYLRFHGKGKKWYDYLYSEKELEEWYKKIQKKDLKEIYIYFNNDIHANAPKNALQLKELFD